jgi:hypothetical protein
MSRERWETSGTIRRRLEKIYNGWINEYEFNLYMSKLVDEGFVVQKETSRGCLFRAKANYIPQLKDLQPSFQRA